MGITTIKLSQLRLSPLNQRRVKPSAVEAMADDIAAHGLLQNLVAYEDEGLFYVFAGGRRYRGLKELAKRKRIKNSDTFPVEVRTKEEAIELSLAENFQREDMHPADSIRAFAALRDTGMDAEEIAARFGQAVSFVYKMLRLSALAPTLIDLIAKDQLSLEAARALTLTEDHDQQIKVCKAANVRLHTGGSGSGFARDALPEALRSAHDEIIDMRNKRYAHVAEHDSVNDEMEIQEDEGRFIVNLGFRFGFYIGGSNDWTKLVDALDEIFAERGQKIVERLQARTGREWSIAQGPPPDATPT